MSSVTDISGIPTEGKMLIIVATVKGVLHFRIFDADGKAVVDTDETRLAGLARQIEHLRKQLEGLWPPHVLTWYEKSRVNTAVTWIAGHTPQLTREQYEDQLARAWFTLEERAKETFGAVELIHCLYYTNPTVIEEISRFLAEEGTSER
jgi:hypothetical protein